MVDSAIVKSDGNKIFDFYMVSNNNPKTASALPVHYSVVLNTTNLSKRDIEDFTYHQAYNYFGFLGPIKVPATVKYAQKKAYHVYDNKYASRDGQNKPLNTALESSLHFL